MLGLAAYLTVFVSAPAWHSHDAAGGEPATPVCPAGSHAHGSDGPGHLHTASDTGSNPVGPCDGHGHAPGEDCSLCELIAQCPLPVSAPAVEDGPEPLPLAIAPAASAAPQAFYGTDRARGPPRA